MLSQVGSLQIQRFNGNKSVNLARICAASHWKFEGDEEEPQTLKEQMIKEDRIAISIGAIGIS